MERQGGHLAAEARGDLARRVSSILLAGIGLFAVLAIGWVAWETRSGWITSIGVAEARAPVCDRQWYRKVTAPGGNRVAVVALVECPGGLYRTEVSIAADLAEFALKPPPAFFAADSYAHLTLAWVGDTRLSVYSAQPVSAKRHELSVGDIAIEYFIPETR